MSYNMLIICLLETVLCHKSFSKAVLRLFPDASDSRLKTYPLIEEQANSYFDALSKMYFNSKEKKIRVSGTIINIYKTL